MKTKKIIKEIESLPVNERAIIADSILRTLNPPETEISKKWNEIANVRLKELESGEAEAIPGEKVFNSVLKRYSK